MRSEEGDGVLLSAGTSCAFDDVENERVALDDLPHLIESEQDWRAGAVLVHAAERAHDVCGDSKGHGLADAFREILQRVDLIDIEV